MGEVGEVELEGRGWRSSDPSVSWSESNSSEDDITFENTRSLGFWKCSGRLVRDEKMEAVTMAELPRKSK